MGPLDTSRVGEWLRGRHQTVQHKITREVREGGVLRLMAACGVEVHVEDEGGSSSGPFCGRCERWTGRR